MLGFRALLAEKLNDMFIDKFKKEDGYYDQDKCYYEDAESFISTGVLGFCGCGMPDAVLEHVRKALQIVNDIGEKKLTYEQLEERKKEVFANKGAEYFMWYFLDNKKLTQHGGSVPGWLTKKGIELLADLTELNTLKHEA